VIFRTRPDRSWGPPSLHYDGYRVSSPGVKRAGRGVNHPPLSGAEVRRAISLIPLWAFMACCKVNFASTVYLMDMWQQVSTDFSHKVKKPHASL